MTVLGLDKFREALRGFEEAYVLIGGSACDLLLSEQGVGFRATKDLDVVVLVNRSTERFAAAFWQFINDGGYEPWMQKDGSARFYRFVNPRSAGYPRMIELFARHPDFSLANEASEIAPLPFDQNISSLSAILLNDDYYEFILEGLTTVNGISVLDEAHLIPLKMRAHIDLNDRHAQGLQQVNSADLKKHRKDVLRLLELVANDATLDLSDDMKNDAKRFIETVRNPDFRIDQLGISFDREQAINRLNGLCGL